MFQSTHPRRVWLIVGLRHVPQIYVSIHTPTQGVTAFEYLYFSGLKFQSTHPRRVWQCKGKYISLLNEVSIHTPTQGVTDVSFISRSFADVSIHTPTQGVTLVISKSCTFVSFQSTHPRRVWLNARAQTFNEASFNPHTHAGCDMVCPEDRRLMACFNPHTHAGCDCTYNQRITACWFQSTHPRRVWHHFHVHF